MPTFDVSRYSQPFWFSYSLPQAFSAENSQMVRSIADAVGSYTGWQEQKERTAETEKLLKEGKSVAEIIQLRTGKPAEQPKQPKQPKAAKDPLGVRRENLTLERAGLTVDRWLNTLGMRPSSEWAAPKVQRWQGNRTKLIREARRRAQAGEPEMNENEIRSLMGYNPIPGQEPKAAPPQEKKGMPTPDEIRAGYLQRVEGMQMPGTAAEESMKKAEARVADVEAGVEQPATPPTLDDVVAVQSPEEFRDLAKRYLYAEQEGQAQYEAMREKEARKLAPTAPEDVTREGDTYAERGARSGRRLTGFELEQQQKRDTFKKVRESGFYASAPEERMAAYEAAIGSAAFQSKHTSNHYFNPPEPGKSPNAPRRRIWDAMEGAYHDSLLKDYGFSFLDLLVRGEGSEQERKIAALQLAAWSKGAYGKKRYGPLLDVLNLLGVNDELVMTPEELVELEAARKEWLKARIATKNREKAQKEAEDLKAREVPGLPGRYYSREQMGMK